jgi:hypothetical protein
MQDRGSAMGGGWVALRWPVGAALFCVLPRPPKYPPVTVGYHGYRRGPRQRRQGPNGGLATPHMEVQMSGQCVGVRYS